MAVTTPDALTVATLIFEEAHVFDVAAVPEPVRLDVCPTHKAVVPVTAGKELTVTVVVVIQPLLF